MEVILDILFGTELEYRIQWHWSMGVWIVWLDNNGLVGSSCILGMIISTIRSLYYRPEK
jgi:hypothetical protein